MNSTSILWDIVIAVIIVHLDQTVIVIVAVQIVHHTRNVLIHKVENILIIDQIEIQGNKITILTQLIEIRDQKGKEEIHKDSSITIVILTMTHTIIEIKIIEIMQILIIEIIGMVIIKKKIKILI